MKPHNSSKWKSCDAPPFNNEPSWIACEYNTQQRRPSLSCLWVKYFTSEIFYYNIKLPPPFFLFCSFEGNNKQGCLIIRKAQRFLASSNTHLEQQLLTTHHVIHLFCMLSGLPLRYLRLMTFRGISISNMISCFQTLKFCSDVLMFACRN